MCAVMESAELTGLTRMMDRCIVRVISCIHIYVFLSFSLFFSPWLLFGRKTSLSIKAELEPCSSISPE